MRHLSLILNIARMPDFNLRKRMMAQYHFQPLNVVLGPLPDCLDFPHAHRQNCTLSLTGAIAAICI